MERVLSLGEGGGKGVVYQGGRDRGGGGGGGGGSTVQGGRWEGTSGLPGR